ncbi:uncharacterized protein [Paramisgurnus dabryanus]|uniref:uncharacterized protein n=1 Tax=Paramisgurnus dabryanus TaxID=90735 RepID=UPI0031F463CA
MHGNLTMTRPLQHCFASCSHRGFSVYLTWSSFRQRSQKIYGTCLRSNRSFSGNFTGIFWNQRSVVGAPFSSHNRSYQPSPLTFLNGRAPKGYTAVQTVKRPVMMQLCLATASSWKDKPALPSRACKQSFTLTVSAYWACGEEASALHAMALLQIHQAKALINLHEGGHDQAVFSDLHAATDLALRATKITAQAVCLAMSTLGFLESHLWLCQADMREADKKHLNNLISQASLFGDVVKSFTQQFSATQKQTEAISHILPHWKPAAPSKPSTSAPQPHSCRGCPAVASSIPPPRTLSRQC